jgi:hypothetical protein
MSKPTANTESESIISVYIKKNIAKIWTTQATRQVKIFTPLCKKKQTSKHLLVTALIIINLGLENFKVVTRDIM